MKHAVSALSFLTLILVGTSCQQQPLEVPITREAPSTLLDDSCAEVALELVYTDEDGEETRLEAAGEACHNDACDCTTITLDPVIVKTEDFELSGSQAADIGL